MFYKSTDAENQLDEPEAVPIMPVVPEDIDETLNPIEILSVVELNPPPSDGKAVDAMYAPALVYKVNAEVELAVIVGIALIETGNLIDPLTLVALKYCP